MFTSGTTYGEVASEDRFGGAGPTDYLETMPTTAVTWGYLPTGVSGDARSYHEREMAWLHRRGVHFIGGYMAPSHHIGESVDPPAEWAATDLAGNPIDHVKPAVENAQHGTYWMNVLHPAWQETLLETAKAAIDMGMEGIVFDDTPAQRWVVFQEGGSFDEYSIAGFRAFLAEHFDEDVLAERFDIGDVETFDFGEYIRDHGLEETWNDAEGALHPLTYEFARFQFVASIRALQRIGEALHEYAREEHGRQAFFSMSVNEGAPTEGFDYTAREMYHFFDGFSVHKGAVWVTLLGGRTDRVVMLAEVSQDRGALPHDTEHLFPYMFADTYAADGRLIVEEDRVYTMRDWTYLPHDEWVTFDVEVAGRYARFASENAHLFGLEAPADVAVVNSAASREGGQYYVRVVDGDVWWAGTEALGVVDALLDLHVPVDAIHSGTGLLDPERLALESLSRYRLVVLPAVFAISDEEVEAVLEYVRGGGAVVAITDFGTHALEYRPRDRPALDPLREAGEHRLGEGYWYTVIEPLGLHYQHDDDGRSYLPSERTGNEPELVEIRKILDRYVERPITTDAPPTINLHRYVDGERVVLHVVNYDYDHRADAFTPAGPFDVEVVLPDGLVPRTASMYDFERASVSSVDVTVSEGRATFTVPKMTSYVVVELIA